MNAFQDGTGATSSMRVVMLLWIALLIGANIFSLVTKGVLVDMSSAFVEITLFILGGKVGQSFAENKAPQPPSA
jgi:hypothetical protein